MRPKNLEHHDAKRALASTFVTAFEHDYDARVFARILHGPRQPAHQVLELPLVAPADHFPDMPQQGTHLLPSLARRHTKPPPQVELVWFRCAAGLEDNLP